MIGRSYRIYGASRKVLPREYLYSFVPAESAVIGITDKILTRVQTRESVSKVSHVNH
jgi:hypothetical protein